MVLLLVELSISGLCGFSRCAIVQDCLYAFPDNFLASENALDRNSQVGIFRKIPPSEVGRIFERFPVRH